MTRILIAIVCCLILIGCTDAASIEENSNIENKSAVSLTLVDAYMFRRAYHGHDTLDGHDLDTFMNRNPEPVEEYTFSQKHPLYNELRHWGFIADDNLNINDIDTLPDQFELQGPNKRIFHVETDYIEDLNEKTPFFELTFMEKDTLVLKDTLWFEWPPDVVFLKKDIDKNGTEELLSIYRWYIINGDNFDVSIYTLKE